MCSNILVEDRSLEPELRERDFNLWIAQVALIESIKD